jgi:uncharacterized protein YhbP (UPF0306 family)
MTEPREILAAICYMTLATADADGTPWASPVYYASEDQRTFWWVSRPEARHSRNIAARPEIAAVIFDSTQPIGTGEAVYFTATAEQVAGAEVAAGIAVFSRISLSEGAGAWSVADVSGDAHLRLYRATVVEISRLGEGDKRVPW